MRWSAGLVLVLSGCHALLGIDDFHTGVDAGDAPADAMADAEIDAPSDSLTCYGTLKSICFTSPPSGTVTLSGPIDTTTDARCANYPQAGGPDLCVISGGSIIVNDVPVQGSRPLVLVAVTTITVNAPLDASSHIAGGKGASANGAGCTVTAGSSNLGGGGGAGGGGFGAAGGAGGTGANNGNPGPGGAAIGVTLIRGGCAGGKGGDGDSGSGGTAGASGGALALLAGTSIVIANNGAVYASGSGGGQGSPGGAQNRGAGGGGGSGGLIVLEAPTITVTGTITANGGGGGGGADAGQGNPGQDGKQANYSIVATGGQNEGGTHGGPGGDGGALAIAARNGNSPINAGGGGGGGGAVGIVWVHGALTGAKVSPAPQVH